MSLIILNVDEVRRTLSVSDASAFVVNDKNVDVVRFALMAGFTDIALDERSALRVMYQRPGETEVRAKTLTYYDTDGIRNYYDWELLAADLAEKGALNCALCILRADTEVEEWHTTPYQIRVLGSIHTDDSDEGDETITPTVAERVAILEAMVQRVASGAPIVVASTSEMTDTDQIYVLKTDGKWYYHDGSAWTAGGEYGAVSTDTTLTQSGIPADAKTVGDGIANLKEDLSEMQTATSEDVGKALKAKMVENGKVTEWEFGATGDENAVPFPVLPESQYGTSGQVLQTLGNGKTKWTTVGEPDPTVIETAVSDWLDAHPEATTTVVDSSITTAKLADWTVPFVYPEQFGAIGDGVTDDAPAIQSAINYCIQTGKKLIFMPKIYGVVPYQEDKTVIIYNSVLYALIIKGSIYIDLNGATIQTLPNTIKDFTTVSIRDTSDVIFKNGTIIGDRDTYTVSGDGAQLLGIFDSKRILVDNIKMRDSKGDCFGHGGVQINQPSVTREFEDFYMGNIISNCTMSHSARHGMTFGKGRGVTFFNCRIENVRPEDDLTWSGHAVDMEPYYGYGSIYDVRFIGCSMTDNANGSYFQHCDGIRVENCYLQSIGFRSALNCMVSDSFIEGNVSSISSGVVVDNTRILQLYNVTNDIDVYTNLNVLPDNIIRNSKIKRVNVNMRSLYSLGKLIISNNDIENENDNTYAPIQITGKQVGTPFSEIIINDNFVSYKTTGFAPNGGMCAVITTTSPITIIGNVFMWDAEKTYTGTSVLALRVLPHVSVINNTFICNRKQDVEYKVSFASFFNIYSVTTPVMIKGNVINAENTVFSNTPPVFIGEPANTEAASVAMLDNYVYGVSGKVATATLLVDAGNVINNETA